MKTVFPQIGPAVPTRINTVNSSKATNRFARFEILFEIFQISFSLSDKTM